MSTNQSYPNQKHTPAAPARGLGAALPPELIQEQHNAERIAEEEASRPKPPSVPYRADTTGLSTANLPKPPVRRADAASPGPAPPAAKRPTPSLPPRLPPRQNSQPDEHTPGPPPTYRESAQARNSDITPNQSAFNRLGQAGISVPGLNIGRDASPLASSRPTESPVNSNQNNQMNELQSRFSKMSSPSSSATANAPSKGTTWAEKQAAAKTLSNVHKDPSSVSFADARSAASTANNFRQRHGEQVASGMQTANGLNQRYGGVADRFGGAGAATASPQASPTGASAAATKKPPPPPPPKKAELGGQFASEPPPVPKFSKPRPA